MAFVRSSAIGLSWKSKGFIETLRPVSTSLQAFRRFKRPPEPVPKWANYDGNRPSFPGESDSNRLIWEGYKRNFKGGVPPKKTRITCIRGEKVTGNPCPICSRRIDIQPMDAQLLSQFICPHSGKILQPKRTGLCRKQQRKLENAIEEARSHGYLPFTVQRMIPEEAKRTPPWNKVDVLE